MLVDRLKRTWTEPKQREVVRATLRSSTATTIGPWDHSRMIKAENSAKL
jgi:hypothetical protein